MMVTVGGGGGGGGTPGTLTITIDHTKCGTADTTNYPLRLDITHASLKSVANGGLIADAQGDDIVITSDLAGTTPLSYDPLILWDASTGRVVTNVKIPTLSHTSDTVIYVQCGVSGVTTFQGGATGAAWDANFVSVYSFGDGSTLNLNDLTSNANTLTNNSTGALAGATAGPAGGAIDFTNAVSLQQYARGANVLNLATPTFEAWVLPDSSAFGGGRPFQALSLVNGVNNGTADHTLSVHTSSEVDWYLFDGSIHVINTTAKVSFSAWNYLAGIGDGSNMSVFLNAVSGATTANGNSFTGYSVANLFINGVNSGLLASTYLNGKIADVRISNVARSTSYLTATSNNISSPSTFYTVT